MLIFSSMCGLYSHAVGADVGELVGPTKSTFSYKALVKSAYLNANPFMTADENEKESGTTVSSGDGATRP